MKSNSDFGILPATDKHFLNKYNASVSDVSGMSLWVSRKKYQAGGEQENRHETEGHVQKSSSVLQRISLCLLC